MNEKTKKVIILNDVKGTNIQQAIFVLKDNKDAMAYFDIIEEANDVINKYIKETESPYERTFKKKRRLFGK